MYRRCGNRWIVKASSRYVVAAIFAVALFLELPGLVRNTDRPGLLAFDALIVAALIVLCVRSWRSATLIVGTEEVVSRGLLRTRRWRRTAVASFASDTRVIGP